MNHKPNAFQQVLHAILSQRFLTQLLSRVTEPADKVLFALTKGRHTFTQLVGWPIIELESIGARTGKPRLHLLIGLRDGNRIAIIGSNYGRARHPGWAHNLRAHPRCIVHTAGRAAKYLAREADGEERAKYWGLALEYYKGYAAYEQRAAPRKISVWILEPINALS